MVARIFPPGSEYDFQVEVIDSDWVNAVAFPGGKILISHGLLEKGHPVANVEAPGTHSFLIFKASQRL